MEGYYYQVVHTGGHRAHRFVFYGKDEPQFDLIVGKTTKKMSSPKMNEIKRVHQYLPKDQRRAYTEYLRQGNANYGDVDYDYYVNVS
jgi:hypothetical protein